MTSTFMKRLALAGLLTVSAFSALAQAPAASYGQKHHPRRAEVNARLAHQHQRIDRAVANGTMTPRKAARLHRADHQIRRDERAMAAQHGGHITRQDQAVLNRRENAVSRQIAR